MILIPERKGIMIFFLLCASLLTNAQQRLQFSLSTGYQSEDFRWSIAGNAQGTNPNILSELKWKNLSGPTIAASAQWNFWKAFRVRSVYSRLFISSGSVTDMDYQGDNRTDRSYYGAFDANKGNSFSWRTTLEYAFKINRKWAIIPSAGYVLHEQALHISSSDQSGTSAGLQSTYDTRYQGVVTGLRAEIPLSTHFSLEAGLLYDIVKYRGRADWNLIPTFRHPLSFEDRANGYNLEGNVKLGYSRGKWTFFLSGNILHGKTGIGTDMLYQQNGQDVATQFNEAVRDYFGFGLGARLTLF